MKIIITAKQIEAYRLCFIVGLTHNQAADVLHISRQAVTQLLRRLKSIRPELFEHLKYRINHNNTISFTTESKNNPIVKKW